MAQPGMLTSALLQTKALVSSTWGRAATVPTVPASAFFLQKNTKGNSRLQLERLVHREVRRAYHTTVQTGEACAALH